MHDARMDGAMQVPDRHTLREHVDDYFRLGHQPSVDLLLVLCVRADGGDEGAIHDVEDAEYRGLSPQTRDLPESVIASGVPFVASNSTSAP